VTLLRSVGGLMAFSSRVSNFFRSKWRNCSRSSLSLARCFSLMGFAGFFDFRVRGTMEL